SSPPPTPQTLYKPILKKQISYLHGEPRILWEEEEVDQMIIKEDLQFAVIGKFLYSWPDIQDLRRLIPKQYEMKGEVNIGLLSNRYILIQASRLEDYVSLLSKQQFHITHNHMSYLLRTLKWDPCFDPSEETSIAIAWISFPALPPNIFGEKALFSIAAAVGKPLQVDLATKNKTRPNCARVNVEVDLLGDFLKRINLGMRIKTGEVKEKWITIKYDYVPKYCKNCKLQGHNENECFIIHPKLYQETEGTEAYKKEQARRWDEELPKEDTGKAKVGENEVFQEQRRKTYQKGGRQPYKGKVEHKWNPIPQVQEKGTATSNKFGVLDDTKEDERADNEKEKKEYRPQHDAHSSVNDVGKEDRHKDSEQSENTSPRLEEYNDNVGVTDEDEAVPVTNQDSKLMEKGEINEEEIAQENAKINTLSEQEIKEKKST
ncbi:hypothetical protein MTR67_026373, partial [Solanum verrucosum]